MTTNKPNLSDLLRQEVKQEKPETTVSPSAKKKTDIPEKPAESQLSRMTKAQLLEHINALYEQKSTPVAAPENSDITAKNKALADQVKDLEKKIATQEQAIAKAEGTIVSLKANSSEKAKLEKELAKQQGLVNKLYTQIQSIEAQKEAEAEQKERTVEEDRALVLARIASYQVNLKFPSQPSSSIIEDQIGWFD
ncbi:MAG: hypothetical protein HC799_13545 [Limnothrix sp. RL_2_0]|nr:hypothetical protein [Limnothrix sp. RL_2_0]